MLTTNDSRVSENIRCPSYGYLFHPDIWSHIDRYRSIHTYIYISISTPIYLLSGYVIASRYININIPQCSIARSFDAFYHQFRALYRQHVLLHPNKLVTTMMESEYPDNIGAAYPYSHAPASDKAKTLVRHQFHSKMEHCRAICIATLPRTAFQIGKRDVPFYIDR